MADDEANELELTGTFRSPLDTEDDPGPDTIVLDEMDLMATSEFQRFARPGLPADDTDSD